MNNIDIVQEATEENIAWVKSMGGYVPNSMPVA